jgi:hypothetical protein
MADLPDEMSEFLVETACSAASTGSRATGCSNERQ